MSNKITSIDIELLELAREKELTDDTIIEIQKIIDSSESRMLTYLFIAVILTMVYTIVMVN